jgi:hypothetical protein
MATGWGIGVGQTLLRVKVHEDYGGGGRGGMEPSAQTPNVLLFTEASAGERFGYKFDGWHKDGTYHYTGEGQVGDQVMSFGNKAVRDHTAQGRALRLFRADGREVTYLGEFEMPAHDPYFFDEAPDRDGNLRKVIVFRLQPVGQVLKSPSDQQAPAAGTVTEVPVEAHNIEKYERQHPDEPAVVVRREAELVGRYVAYLGKQGQATMRHKVPTPAGRSMYTDLFNKATQELIEAKASSSRTHVRAGLGQVLDYARYVHHDKKALLLGSEPESDLIDLLVEHGVSCIWETNRNKFDRRDAK